ncbi:uncharacterized protein EDB91DRAFT_1045332 [Suillus paluster]|uniref:uncharacterized protein n=1 Tax=Suillus paluster TaxID=48578 RepID=UPI001B87A452|nr:uncharacterized protein EDB91DRAFT_1045332 [Suillus paluster]KAG1751621.1 hypothetical protein EDB91DRAFT_1045332 [Suillus paluster]
MSIEKLEETWTSGSITTLFRLLGSAAAISVPLRSPVAGLSWRLIVKRWQPSRRQLLFDSHNCPDIWRGTPVNITVSFPSHPDDPSLFTTSILGDGNTGDYLPLITCHQNKLRDALISLKVTFTNPLTCNLFDVLAHVGPIPDAPASADEPRALQACSALRALEQSFKTGTSFDIIFQAYTRRLSPGKVARPIPIYANTTVMQTTTLLPDFSTEEDPDLSDLFELSEGDTLPFTSPESYEYESDSDLDDDDDDNNLAVVQPQPSNRTLLLEDVEMVPVVTNVNLKYGYRVVLIKGVAWRTWHTFIYYCYTGIVNFTNLRSQGPPKAALQRSHLVDGPPHCSPKSMYQLARKLHNEPLSQLALTAIETRLFAANILDEVFSKFTSRHDAVREMEIPILVKHRNASDVQQGLPTKMEAVAMGNIPHAGPVLTAFYQRFAQTPCQN